MIDNNNTLTLLLCGDLHLCYTNGSAVQEELLFNLLFTCKIAGALVKALADGSPEALEWVARWLRSPPDYRAALGRWRLFQPRTLDWKRGFSCVVSVEPVTGSWQNYMQFPYHLYIKYDDNDSSSS